MNSYGFLKHLCKGVLCTGAAAFFVVGCQPKERISENYRPLPPLSPPAYTSKALISLTSERTKEVYTCESPETSNVLLYPTDISVSSDGKTVYAINSGCNSAWNLTNGVFPEDVLPGCSQAKGDFYHLRRQQIYRLHAGKSPELPFENMNANTACVLGRSLEIDREENLYITSDLERSIFILNSKLDPRKILEVREKSNAFSPTLSPYPISGLREPFGLQVVNDKLIYGLTAQSDFSDFRIRNIDLKTDSHKELLIG